MLRRVQHGRPRREGTTVKHDRSNEANTHCAYGGRRRVYARIANIQTIRPDDTATA